MALLYPPHSQPNPTPNLYCALSEPQRPQQANSHVTACKTAHVCIDAQAYRRVAEVDSQIKYQIMEFYAVLRHFVSLRITHRLQYLAMYLILWCPHTDSNLSLCTRTHMKLFHLATYFQ